MSDDRTLLIDDVRVPRLLYGTAWKENQTRDLVKLALSQGFRGIDTANQRRHYHEVAVGQGISDILAEGTLTRGDLFLQTKYTFRPGQDNRLPYAPDVAIAVQVAQSFESSLRHLHVETMDSYVLHGPMQSVGLSDADWEAWRAMETLHDRGQTRLLGVSNVNLAQLQALCEEARIRPRFVQNRCYAVRGWDHNVRAYCSANGIVYQGFSLLTANREVLAQPEMNRIAVRHNRSIAQVVFRFALDIGMVALTGTTDVHHMRDDLDVFTFRLTPEEIARIESLNLS